MRYEGYLIVDIEAESQEQAEGVLRSIVAAASSQPGVTNVDNAGVESENEPYDDDEDYLSSADGLEDDDEDGIGVG